MHRVFPSNVLFVLACVLLATCSNGIAQTDDVQGQKYVEIDRDWMRICGAPPSPGSVEDEKEIAVLLWLQKTRNTMSVSQGWTDVNVTISSFQEPLGFPIQMVHMTAFTNAFNAILVEADQIIFLVKDKVKRKRPYKVIVPLNPAMPLPRSSSFPSGHGVRGALAAILLGDLFPERRNQLLQRGNFIGDVRVVVGLHYPSDVEAGKTLGRNLAVEVLKSDAWKGFKEKYSDEIALIKSQIAANDHAVEKKINQ